MTTTVNFAKRLMPLVLSLVWCAFLYTSAAQAIPVKLRFELYMGKHVNKKTNGDVCTSAEANEGGCQPGAFSSEPGGYKFPEGVAGAPNGDVYVADKGNHRVQELDSSGTFVRMFGEEGSGAGQMDSPQSVAVDPVSGDVYVAEAVFGIGTLGERVQEFTANGEFVLEIGKGVNETTKGNLCTKEEEGLGAKCGPTTQRPFGVYEWGSEHGAFNFQLGPGNLIASGGPEDLLYVGDEGRVQVFKGDGEWQRDIVLPSGQYVRALAVDQSTGDLYVNYGSANVIRVFDAAGEEVKAIEIAPTEENATVRVQGIAIDGEGHLAVAGEQESRAIAHPFGSLYNAGTAEFITTFVIPTPSVKGIGFNGNNQLYAAAEGGGQQLLGYRPVPVAELKTGAAECSEAGEQETNVSIDCVLHGEVNPEGVAKTQVWLECGGRLPLGERTPKQPVNEGSVFVPVEALVTRLPNSPLYYQIAGEDANVEAPEALEGSLVFVMTPLAAPRVVGVPSASFVKASSAVLYAELNPENADTRYSFEYAPGSLLTECASIMKQCRGPQRPRCSGVGYTSIGHSGVYGKIGATLEAMGLQPATEYRFRLFAESENAAKTESCEATGEEGTFTTKPPPAPTATTGSASEVKPTTAVIAGTIDPDGLPATYAFELGVYNGADTQYGVVFSGDAGSAASEEKLLLTGLQPGTTYAYRIAVSSGYIGGESHTVQSAPATFTTQGLPEVIVVPEPPVFLPPPAGVRFPVESTAGTAVCKRGHLRKGKCVKTIAKKGGHGRRRGHRHKRKGGHG